MTAVLKHLSVIFKSRNMAVACLVAEKGAEMPSKTLPKHYCLFHGMFVD